MLRGKQRKIKLRSETGLFVTEEDGIVFEVERFWGEMFCLKGNANLNIRKMMVDGGMKYGGEHIIYILKTHYMMFQTYTS